MFIKKSFIFFTILYFCNSFIFAQNTTQQIDSIVKSFHQKHPEISFSIGFIQNNKEFYTAYGNLSKQSTIAVNKNSIFEIASVTKIITSNLIAQAVLDNKLKVTDYIDAYLPKQYVLHKNLQQKIKISDLAAHISGLPDINFKELIAKNPQQPTSSITQQTLATLVNTCTSLKDYGNYRYSNISYVLLGQILETIYDKSYNEILHEKLITPLQLTNTLTTDFNRFNTTVGYNSKGGLQEFFVWNVVAPAGLLKSSTSDLITYTKALLQKNSTIGKAALLMEKVVHVEDGDGVGLGLIIVEDNGNTLYLKTGDSMGQASLLCYNRAKNWGIVILMNQANSSLRSKLLNTIYDTVLQ